MAAILPGFEYDIFISYRQNDNKYDGWVTEFVTKLRQELEAVVKDNLSIYFDENPKDGIRETDQVDNTITNKLKCLIFIPIISQTYCDTKAFAWEQEFIAFRDFADSDRFGRNIVLPNRNVASRILPIKIHEIDLEDVRLLESTLSGIMRSLDFIYQATGVNRPLRAKDDDFLESKSQVQYRNQINKVANAIKEIVGGAKLFASGKSQEPTVHTVTSTPTPNPPTFHASLPETIRMAVIQQSKPIIYLAWTSQDLKSEREELAIILQKAGFDVIPGYDCPADDEEFKKKVQEDIQKCDGSLHVLSGEFGRRFESDDEVSFPQYQLDSAMRKSSDENSEFQTFVWLKTTPETEIKTAQHAFINRVRNGITKNMMFSNTSGSMQLVDDMRVVLRKDKKEEMDVKDTDIFFIFSQQDESDAQSITDMISEEYPVEVLNILPDGEEEYREMSKQQIPRSKLAVVYFKYAADWAIPFIKQIWKQVGGASSPTHLMLIGEDDPSSNMARSFKAPKVISTIVSKSNVPDEVKKVYIHVVNLK